MKKEIATRLNKPQEEFAKQQHYRDNQFWQASPTNILEVVCSKKTRRIIFQKLNLPLHASTNIHYFHTLSYPYYTVAKKVNVLQIRYLDI